MQKRPFLYLLFFLFAACQSSETINPKSATTNQTTEKTEPIIPGPRNCFWSRGPVSKDPYINIAYPDAGVFYWNAVFTIPEGASLFLEGQFPHSRYISLISYDGRGAPIESLADYLINPQDGSTNPFQDGADRESEDRNYQIEIVGQPVQKLRLEGIRLPAPKQLEGQALATNKSNQLHAPAYGKGQQSLLYRIYIPDQNTDETGGVGLPTPVLVLANGDTLRGDDTCPVLNSSQPLQLTPDAIGVPMSKYYELVNQPDKPATHPATNPPTWYLQYDRKFLLGIYNGDFPDSPRKSTGGFYPNVDNNYVRTIVNRKFGKVFVLRGRLPKTPQTWKGDKTNTSGEVVYWSLCSNQGFANTRVNDCLFDEQVPVNKNGDYVIVVSREEDRPRNARPECGIGWLPMADDGDGALDEDVTVVQIRNMLASPDFPHSIQKVKDIGTEKEIMGPYLPQSFYVTTSAFEVLFPCMQ